jgi:hypothetical protein
MALKNVISVDEDDKTFISNFLSCIHHLAGHTIWIRSVNYVEKKVQEIVAAVL